MTQFQNDTLALLADYDMSHTTPDAGRSGYRRPENGIHTLNPTDLIIDFGDEKQPVFFGTKEKNVPGMNIQFVYQTMPEPDSDEQPYTFYGREIRLPAPGQKQAALALGLDWAGEAIERNENVWANYVKIITDHLATNLQADVAEIVKKIQAGNLTVRARCRTWNSKKINPKTSQPYTNFEENLQEKLSD